MQIAPSFSRTARFSWTKIASAYVNCCCCCFCWVPTWLEDRCRWEIGSSKQRRRSARQALLIINTCYSVFWAFPRAYHELVGVYTKCATIRFSSKKDSWHTGPTYVIASADGREYGGHIVRCTISYLFRSKGSQTLFVGDTSVPSGFTDVYFHTCYAYL